MWEKMTEKAVVQLKKQEEAKRIPMSTSYEDFYSLQGFKVKDLGLDIDEEVSIFVYNMHIILMAWIIYKPWVV